jgi:K+/H+ antiporter YhaU regulatory subunit KhtT
VTLQDINELKSKLLNSQWTRYIICLLAGATIGVIFYPSKRTEETVAQKYEQQISELKQTHDSELKTQQKQFSELSEKYSSYKEESERKISSLTVENQKLSSKKKRSYYKIIHPDGTIEIKEISESQTDQSSQVTSQIQDEFKQKLDSIEQKWKTIHETQILELQKKFDEKEADYQKEIESLKVTKVTTVNEKKFSIEGGILSDSAYYMHATMDVWGPFFIGLHGEMNHIQAEEGKLGLGIGLRF